MKTKLRMSIGLATVLAATMAWAAPSTKLVVHVDHFAANQEMPSKFAVCVAKANDHMGFGQDINPSISWSPGPKGTQSYAIFLEDSDSPAEHRDWMNKPGKVLTSKVTRQIFFHWVLVDIPANVTSIGEGEVSRGLVAHGKPQSPSAVGLPGINTYTAAFASKPEMNGTYYGYDGPCPPWNDDVVHHYHFMVYALSIPTLGLKPDFDGAAALAAMQGKILARGHEVGLYTTNPAERPN